MTVAEILQQLQVVPLHADFAPYAIALDAAVDVREALTPELIAAIDRVSADPAHYRKHPDQCLHIFAIALLAQFREARARDAILRLFTLPNSQGLELTGEMVYSQGAIILASVCGGDPAPLFRLVFDEDLDESLRAQAIDALRLQSRWGERPRAAVIADLRRVFQQLARPGNSSVWAALVSTVCDFKAVELIPEARQAFAECLVDEYIIRENSLDEVLEEPPTPAHAQLSERFEPIDVVDECSSWECFQPEEKYPPLPAADLPSFNFAPSPPLPPIAPASEPGRAITTGEQPYHAPPKVGRNDPCPCGSGQKHKKCCGKK